jgi:polyphosphate:AMP phosphotransferase
MSEYKMLNSIQSKMFLPENNISKSTAKYLPGILQRKAIDKNIPVLILMEGWHFSGKGYIINELLKPMDPRGYKVFNFENFSKKEKSSPFMWPFWQNLPQRGNFGIFSSGWYYRLLYHFFKRGRDDNLIQIINNTEKLLIDDGYIILKFFLHINEKEQYKRMKSLSKDKNSSWLVNKKDEKQNKHYEKFCKLYDHILEKTNTDYSKWLLIDANDKKSAGDECTRLFLNILEEKISKINKEPIAQEAHEHKETEMKEYVILDNVDHNKKISDSKYKKELPKLQKKVNELQLKLLKKKTSVIMAFEGWDAAGKGGSIKRLTAKMDPRGYRVNPYSAPDSHELKYNYLWRFWKNFPTDGRIAIFDRSWYGRVLVERVEGFASRNEWERAYKEINDMEFQLHYHGIIIMKFWLEIDEETQLRRFKERENSDYKKWKITDEDWRNRSKRSLYKIALEEMLEKTSHDYAPWIIIEGDCKKSERIKVLKEAISNIEKIL